MDTGAGHHGRSFLDKDTNGTIGEMIDMQTKVRSTLALLATVGLAACGSAQADGTEDAAANEAYVRVINVEVTTLDTETFIEEIRLTSVAMANQDVEVAAEESGVIRELFADRGDRVEEGAPIAKIDDRLLSTQVAQARAASELANQTWQRRERLWTVDSVGSELAYLEAKFAAEQSAATLEGLEERLSRTVVRSPFTGVLEERMVDVGATVAPGDPIARVVDLNPIKVFAGVPERYARDIEVGAPAELSFDALGGAGFQAEIRYVGATINPGNRTFPVEVQLANSDGAIKPQMVANMALTRHRVDGAIVVPQDALVRVENGYVAYVVVEGEGGEVAEVRALELGATRRNLVVVDSGLAVGDRLVVVGQKSIANGDRVNVVGERD
jgi:RND family efflux transporter MFP subunit